MSKLTLPASLGALLLGLPSVALGWTHTTKAWIPQEDFPFEWFCAARADCEETVVDTLPEPENYCQVMTQQAHDAWKEQAPCASITNIYMGENPNLGYISGNEENWNSFNDPGADGDITTRDDDDIPETATLAATLTWGTEQLTVINGQVYYHATDSDIVFNDNVFFGAAEDMGPGCSGQTDILAVQTHEVGHLYGMGHSCEEGESCVDPKLAQATMFWSTGPCDPNGETLNEDDIEGINALYGPSASFVCSHELSDELAVGNVPFELKCAVVSDYLNEIDEVEWRWGDGATGEGTTASHTYTEAGNYTVEVDVHGDREACGEDGWTNTFRKVGYVRACDVPVPEFTIEHIDGLKYAMLNETDVSVYGCYSNIEWQVYKGGAVSGEPLAELTYNGWEPNITFPEDGEYTVVLNIGGPAGTGAASLTFEADNHRGEGYAGCNSAAGLGGGAALTGLAALLARRARRRV